MMPDLVSFAVATPRGQTFYLYTLASWSFPQKDTKRDQPRRWNSEKLGKTQGKPKEHLRKTSGNPAPKNLRKPKVKAFFVSEQKRNHPSFTGGGHIWPGHHRNAGGYDRGRCRLGRDVVIHALAHNLGTTVWQQFLGFFLGIFLDMWFLFEAICFYGTAFCRRFCWGCLRRCLNCFSLTKGPMQDDWFVLFQAS